MTNISHLRNSSDPIDRARFWLADLSWSSTGDFETLQNLSFELENTKNIMGDLLAACERTEQTLRNLVHGFVGGDATTIIENELRNLQNTIAKARGE